jgi:hypothetical protein
VFEIDDLEEPWTFTTPFDFIFARMTVGAFADSARFFQQAFENLTPGGWVESLDIVNPVKADDSSLSPDAALLKWFVLCSLRVCGADLLGRISYLMAAGGSAVRQTVLCILRLRWKRRAL